MSHNLVGIMSFWVQGKLNHTHRDSVPHYTGFYAVIAKAWFLLLKVAVKPPSFRTALEHTFPATIETPINMPLYLPPIACHFRGVGEGTISQSLHTAFFRRQGRMRRCN